MKITGIEIGEYRQFKKAMSHGSLEVGFNLILARKKAL